MTTDRELMQQALDALEDLHRTGDTQVFDMCHAPKLLPALRARLAQPEREWQGLTDEEIDETAWPYFIGNIMPSVKIIVRQLEAKLKEKNN